MYNSPGGGGGRGGGGAKKCRAIYDYNGENPSDLTFKKGDIITVTSENARSGPEWWQGECRGRRGSFPYNHVELMENSGGGGGGYGGGNNNNNSYGGGGKSYNDIPMSTYSPPSNSSPPINSSSNNEVSSNTESQKPPKQKKEKSFSSGGGGSDDKKYKIGFAISIGVLLVIALAAIFPWYYNTIGNNVTVFQWDGVCEYPQGLKNPQLKGASSSSVFLRTYRGLNWKNLRTLSQVSLAFIIIGFCFALFSAGVFYALMKGKEIKPTYVFALCVILCLLLGVAVLSYLGISSAFKKDTKITADGPAKKFSGSAGNGKWGPALGWIFACIGWILSMINIAVSYFIAKENGGLC